MAVMATYVHPPDFWHYALHGWSQQVPTSTPNFTEPTKKPHGKQISEPSSVARGLLGCPNEIAHKRARSFVELKTAINDGNGLDASLVVDTNHASTLPMQTLKDRSKNYPADEDLTRGATVLMPDVSSTPDAWAQMSIRPQPAYTPKSRLSGHVSIQIEESAGETNMESPKIQLEAHGQGNIPFVGMEIGDKEIALSVDILWDQIQRLRLDNWSLRSKSHEMRARLRETESRKAITEDTLFQRIRRKVLLGQDEEPDSSTSEYKTILQLLDDCQSLKDDHGPLEFDCIACEDRLSRQEFRLARMEDEFYSRTKFSPTVSPEVSLGPSPPDFAPRMPELFDNEIVKLDYHPLVTDFLSKLGDLDLVREQLDELMDDKDEFEGEKETRRRMGIALGSEAQNFLDNYQSKEDELMKELQNLEKEVETKRNNCLSKGLIDLNDNPTDFESREHATFNDEEGLNPQDNTSEYVKYPLLLPRVSIKRKEESGLESDPDETADKSSERVNQWLLQRLRTSVLDVRLLASTFEGQWGKMKDGWEILVLNVWFKDGTTKRTGFRAYSSSLSRLSLHRSDSSSFYHF